MRKRAIKRHDTDDPFYFFFFLDFCIPLPPIGPLPAAFSRAACGRRIGAPSKLNYDK
jgi:hypothetical protein